MAFGLNGGPKDKRFVWVIAKIAGSWTRIRIIKVHALTTKITIPIGKKKTVTHLINVSKPALRVRNRFIYLVDILNGQTGFADTNFVMDKEMLDLAMTSPVLDKLVAGIERPELYQYLLYLFMGVAMGMLGGYIIGSKFPM